MMKLYRMDSPTNSSEKSWYLVYTKPAQEKVALMNLERQGYQAYLPRLRQVRKRQGRQVEVIEPLFPRYLFIHLDTHTDNWGPIRSTLGVTSLVRFGKEPARVPESLIIFLKAKASEEGHHVLVKPNFMEGDRVRVADGAFQGYEGILLVRSSRERVVVLLDIAGRQIRTHASVVQLEPGS
jgi:transcriptional antiterminator RfaH